MSLRCAAWMIRALVPVMMAASSVMASEPITLFDGRTLDGWDVITCEAEVQDGAIFLKAGNGLVQTAKKYRDFVLDYQWKALRDDNWDSGVYFRYDQVPAGRPWPARYQVNLRKGMEGNLDGFPSGKNPIATKAGDWNRFELTVQGDTARLKVNGQPAWEVEGLEELDSPIALQAEVPGGGQFLFRDIRLTVLDAPAADDVEICQGLPLVFSEDFEQGAERWETSDDAAWQIQDKDGNKAFGLNRRTSNYQPKYRSPHNIALVKDLEVSDVVIRFRVKSTLDTGGHRDCCVFFGYQSPTQFYYVHLGARPDPNSGQIMIVNEAARTPLTDNKNPTPWTDDWHQVKLVRRVDTGVIEVYFDDMTKPLMTATDKTFGKGRIGIGSFDDMNDFDDIKVYASAEPVAMKALIVTGQDRSHDWAATTPILKRLLEETGLFTVDVAVSPQYGGDFSGFRPEFSAYDLVVMNYGFGSDLWPEPLRQAFEQYVRGGGGLLIYHSANNAFPEWQEYNQMIGVGGWGGRNEKDGPYVRWRDGQVVLDHSPGPGGSHGPQHEFALEVRDSQHPITKGLPPKFMHAADELYNRLRGPARNLTVLATSFSPPDKAGTTEHEPVLMTIQYGEGRVFHTVLGHGPPHLKSVAFIVTFQRGAEWAATGKVTQPVPADMPAADRPVVRE